MTFSTTCYRLGWLMCVLSALPAWSVEDGRGAVRQVSRDTPGLSCDSSIAKSFKPDENTSVLLVKQFKKGDVLPYSPMFRQMFPLIPEKIEADVCLVKLLVGPGNPGPQDAPSTSRGIGIEVWLPSKQVWNGRIHAIGGGGWSGSEETHLDTISSGVASADMGTAATIASREGAVTSSTDTGHTNPSAGGNGAFAMLPDGTANKTLWEDFASRGIHEQMLKTKALVKAYYGSAARYTYWSGGSTGGRQGLKLAQRHPEDADGILVAYPAINWTRFIAGELYPQVVIQRDLGGKYLSPEQLTLVSNAAVAACDTVGGKHLGFILHQESCHYDPTKDRSVLCTANGGTNSTPACISPTQATAFNKIWYGMTVDGSVPDPAVDNGFGPITGARRWYGMQRGTNMQALAYTPPFVVPPDMAALELKNSKLSTPAFKNATGNGQDGWKALSYQQLAQAYDAGLALQREFADINTDDPSLAAFKARGGKLIHFHNTNDELIPYPGSVQYYQRVLEKMGGLAQVQPFYRFYVVPGLGHSPLSGTLNPGANPPTYGFGSGKMYGLLTDWVEKGVAPGKLVFDSASSEPVKKSLPICLYPQKITYVRGDPYAAASYACQ